MIAVIRDRDTAFGPRPMLVVSGRLPTEAELDSAAEAGAGLSISGVRGEISLTPLRRHIGRFPNLRLFAYGSLIRDAHVLEDAASLESLVLEGRVDEPVDLSHLPRLRAFEGTITARLSSISRNPHLEVVKQFGALPARSRTFAGPIRVFQLAGARTDISMPAFSQPEEMKQFTRSRVERFDVADIEQFRQLEVLRIEVCPHVAGLHRLEALPALTSVMFVECAAPEGWERLPDSLPSAWVHAPRTPLPSPEWRAQAAARGWSVSGVPDRTEALLFPVQEGIEDGTWDVTESDFSWLEDAQRAAGLIGLASGTDVEALLRGLIVDLASRGTKLDVSFDSESGMFAAYFTDQHHAERFALEARNLSSNPSQLARYLRPAK